jgi:hypothetical protein
MMLKPGDIVAANPYYTGPEDVAGFARLGRMLEDDDMRGVVLLVEADAAWVAWDHEVDYAMEIGSGDSLSVVAHKMALGLLVRE